MDGLRPMVTFIKTGVRSHGKVLLPTLAKLTVSHMLLLRLTINPGVMSFKLILLLQTLQGFNRTQCAYKSWHKIYTLAKVSES